jgi:hypothetical protein
MCGRLRDPYPPSPLVRFRIYGSAAARGLATPPPTRTSVNPVRQLCPEQRPIVIELRAALYDLGLEQHRGLQRCGSQKWERPVPKRPGKCELRRLEIIKVHTVEGTVVSAYPRDVPELPSTADSYHQQQPMNIKLTQALSPRPRHENTLVLRSLAVPFNPRAGRACGPARLGPRVKLGDLREALTSG